MVDNPNSHQPRPITAPDASGDDPDAGQVMGPDGDAPVDPAARAISRGCVSMLVGVGIVLILASLWYWLFIA